MQQHPQDKKKDTGRTSARRVDEACIYIYIYVPVHMYQPGMHIMHQPGMYAKKRF